MCSAESHLFRNITAGGLVDNAAIIDRDIRGFWLKTLVERKGCLRIIWLDRDRQTAAVPVQKRPAIRVRSSCVYSNAIMTIYLLTMTEQLQSAYGDHVRPQTCCLPVEQESASTSEPFNRIMLYGRTCPHILNYFTWQRGVTTPPNMPGRIWQPWTIGDSTSRPLLLRWHRLYNHLATP